MTTQTHNLTYQDLLGKLERSHESYRELEEEFKIWKERYEGLTEEVLELRGAKEKADRLEKENGECLFKNIGLTNQVKIMKSDHAETEERYQNEIKRLNKIIDSIQGYVRALEVGVR